MAVQKINRLTNEALDYRAEKLGRNKYQNEINEYDANHEDALAHDDDNHPLGKGTGNSLSYTPRDISAPKSEINYKNINTRDMKAGGSYDKNGTKGVEGAFQGDAGRNYMSKINIYSPDNAYGLDSVDIDTTVRGQFIVKN